MYEVGVLDDQFFGDDEEVHRMNHTKNHTNKQKIMLPQNNHPQKPLFDHLEEDDL